MRRRRVLAGAAAALLVLTGCAAATDASWTPPVWEESALAFPAAPEPLDAAAVGSLVGERLRNDAIGLQARVALLPGAAPLNGRALAVVRDAVAARVAATGTAYTPQVFPVGAGLGDRGCARGSTLRPAAELLVDPASGVPGGTGLAVACDVVAAAGPVLGQRLRIVGGAGGVVQSDTLDILYTDVSTGAVVTAGELWSPAAPAHLWTLLVETLRREAGALSLAPVSVPDDAAIAGLSAALSTTVPGPDGSLVFTLPAGFGTPDLAALGVAPAAAPRVVGVPPALARSLAGPLGAALVSAVSAGTAFQAPAPVPAGDGPVDCRLFPCVALTYDDGPGELTPGILDALASRRAAATFFVMGSKMAGSRDLVRRMVAEGHEVENHTWSHPHLPAIPLAAATRQLRDATGAIESASGERVTMFRPPYGEHTPAVLAAAGLPAILWDVDTFDWQGPSDDVLVRRAVDQPQPGSIVLQHDIQPVSARTATAVYDGLLDRGFRLVTVTQLFGALPSSGVLRSAR